MLKNLKVSLIGLVMGIAETIPGVSGGTIAFIFKIYQELLETIRSFDISSLQLLFTGRIKEFFQKINGVFLIFLVIGMFIGIVVGVNFISYHLVNNREPLWGFFFGLVLASSLYFALEIKWNMKTFLLFVFGAILSFYVSQLTPVSGSDNLFFVFICGLVAVSAFMLPGLSGSFILLLLGMYSTIIGSLKTFFDGPALNQTFLILFVFGLGCLIGMVFFSRFLSAMLSRFYTATIAFLCGILAGSLNKLWPWRIEILGIDKYTGIKYDLIGKTLPENSPIKVIEEANLMPYGYSDYFDPRTNTVLLCIFLGIALIVFAGILDRKSKQKQATT